MSIELIVCLGIIVVLLGGIAIGSGLRKSHEHDFSGEVFYEQGYQFQKCVYPGCNCVDPIESIYEKRRDRILDRKHEIFEETHSLLKMMEQEYPVNLEKYGYETAMYLRSIKSNYLKELIAEQQSLHI